MAMGWKNENVDSPHRNLEIWRLAMRLTAQTYRLTANFPDDEKYGLVSQLRRAAVSIPSNIAEGSARRTTADFRRFLYDARGSLVEFDTQMELSDSLGYAPEPRVDRIRETYDNLSRGLNGLIMKLEKER
jgi:four helix bundle protein